MYCTLDPHKYMDNVAFLPAALRSYIPKQLLRHLDVKRVPEHNDLQFIQSVLDNSNDDLRMYGSAENLLKNLHNYIDFPLRRKMFRSKVGYYNYTVPVPYRTFKGDVLYCKQEYLFHLQSCVSWESRLWDDNQSSKYAELIEYMIKHEERLEGCFEFVKYDHEIFESIRKLFSNAASLEIFQDGARTTVNFEESGITACGMEDYQEKRIKVFDELISKHPCLFLPNSETKNKNATAVVRVFLDSSLKFVMESELFAAINLKNPDRKPLECMDTDGQYRIVEYKRVLELFRDEIGDIDFIYHPISICNHRAVPIAAPTGDHCVLAGDALQDILTETFQVLGVFRKLTRNTSHMILKFVAILEKYFPSNIKYRYFINLKVFQKLREELDEFWKPIEDRPVKKVRNVGPNGFTVEDLKKELKYLGYTEIFPEITAEARNTYTSLLQLQTPDKLETREIFLVIEACLMFVMFKRFPCFNEFMYRQKICPHNRPQPCEHCLMDFKDAEARIEAEKKAEQASKSSAVTVTTDEVKKEKNPASPADVEYSEDSKPVKNLEPNSVSPDSSSLICEKCMETSNEAREEVVETYKKMMILEKTLKEKDAELERLRIFEQKSKKSDETEKKMKDLENEAEEWKKKHLKILEENIKMGNMLKNAGNLKALESQLKKKDEQLSTIRSNLKKITQRCESLKKEIIEKDEEIHKLSKAEKSEKQAKEDIEATVDSLLHQLKDKDEEIDELRIANADLEACNEEHFEKFTNSYEELEKRMNLKMEKTDSNIQELKLQISEISEEKNEEIEKLKKRQESIVKENKKQVEQLKRNASISADEVKKLTAQIAKKEAAENRLKQSNKELLEKLQKSDSNLQEITKKQNQLVTEIAGKNRIIQELQKSAEKQVSEQEKARKEIETLLSTIRVALDVYAPLEPTEKPECLICFHEMKSDQKTMKCEHCRKIVHFECASKWLQIHRSCAHCRQEMLNPDEFPNLQ